MKISKLLFVFCVVLLFNNVDPIPPKNMYKIIKKSVDLNIGEKIILFSSSTVKNIRSFVTNIFSSTTTNSAKINAMPQPNVNISKLIEQKRAILKRSKRG